MADFSENNKRIAKNTLMLYFRMLILLIINLYTSRVVLQELGVDDFGIYNVVGGIVIILSFLNSAMATGTQRFMNIEMGRNDINALKKVFITSIQIHTIIAIALFFIADTVGLWFLNTYMNIPEGKVSAANWVFQFSIIASLCTILSVPYNAAIISHEKMSAFAYISIVEAIMKLFVAFAIIWAPFNKLIFYSGLLLLTSLITCSLYVLYGIKHFEECGKISFSVDKKMMKQMLSFSGWTVFGNLGYILHTQGIAILINMFFTVAVNAAQGIANQVNNVVTQFSNNFLIALNPQVVKSYASGDLCQMHSLIIRGCKTAFCMMLFFVIPLILEAPTILYIWLGIVPEYAVIFMRLILLISLINSFSSLLAVSKGATGNIKNYQITLTLIGALHIPLAWLAFELGYGPEYSMYVYLGIVIVLQAIRVTYVCKSVKLSIIRYFKDVIVRCIIVMCLSLIIPTILHNILAPTFLSTLIIVLSSSVSVIIMTMYIALTKKERMAVLKPIISKIKR